MNPETTYLEHLAAIQRIAAFVATSHGCNVDETAEFVQEVCFRLLDKDYDIIRKFKGDSKFTTYLHTVILNMFRACRTEQFGKWRPSADARRLGPKAVELERLLSRDGCTYREAVSILTTQSGGLFTLREIEALYLQLPVRTPRPKLVSDETVSDVVAVDGDAEDRAEADDRARALRRAVEVLELHIKSFKAEERLILRMRFHDARKASDIARVLGVDQKKIYKQVDKLCNQLRRALEAAGIGVAEINRLLGRPDQEIRLDLFSTG